MKNKVNKNQGGKILNARVWAGWDKGIYLKSGGSPAKRANAGRAPKESASHFLRGPPAWAGFIPYNPEGICAGTSNFFLAAEKF